MANGTVIFVDVGSGNQIRIIRWHRRIEVRLLVEIGVLGHMSELVLKRHFGGFGGNRSVATREVEVDTEDYEEDTDHDSDNHASEHSLVSSDEVERELCELSLNLIRRALVYDG